MQVVSLRRVSLDKAPNHNAVPFWQRKSLEELNTQEWESLCDGCGKCCLVKLEDEDTDEIYYTDVACTLFNPETCTCRDYTNRQKKVADCVKLTPKAVKTISWLPPSCAYRLVADGKDLPSWHPLVSGNRNGATMAGASVHGKVAGIEDDYTTEELLDRIVEWPSE
ncbi:YcgN family cysteine cluster protein [Microvirga sp. W0021]|uniref:UPF0260 protein WJT86_05035 n=1 Tax=Hohaiivirga grylli TaxID=3133970 RepID=A0ABV0BIP5_9HYPH